MAKIKKRRAIIAADMKHGPNKKARALVSRCLIHWRTERELTQDALSLKAGMHRTYVGTIERGEKGVGIDTLGKLCEALGITIPEFFAVERDR